MINIFEWLREPPPPTKWERFKDSCFYWFVLLSIVATISFAI